MADYLYTMETRLTPEQQRAVSLVQDTAQVHGMNVYLTGGTMRDLITGFAIRDLDFTVQGNALKLQRDLERAGVIVGGADDDLKSLYLVFPGNVRGEITMARTERYEKPGKPPVISPAAIHEDLRRRDFTVNAMALSLNPGSRGLLLDPSNGVADVELKVLRILHNYAFYEEPSRLVRATRFAARFHWPLEERTQARYDAAKENNYIEYITDRGIGAEIEAIAHEEDPLHIMRVLEKEGWLKVLNPRWSVAKVDTSGLGQLQKMREQMAQFGYNVDAAPAVMHFLTRRLSDKDIADLQKLIPRRSFVQAWRNLEDEAKDLARKLTGKESATPSRAWQVLSEAKPESILFLEVTARQQGAIQKIRNFFGKWRQVQQKLPLPEMAELRITPALPVYPKLAHDVFLLLLDGKMRSRTEIIKFLKPYSPPPPPPPPPPKRARKSEAAAAAGRKPKAKEKEAEAKEAAAKAAPVVEKPVAKPAKPAQPAKAAKSARPQPQKPPKKKPAPKAKKKK